MSEVTDLLRAEGIPDSLLTVLAGMLYCIYKFVHMYICIHDNYFTENHIDGIALVALPEDFEEFKHLIPSTGLRMRIKALIRNRHSSDGIHEVCTYIVEVLKNMMHIMTMYWPFPNKVH